MDFIGVYQSLLELFPEIDARALRAVAIEHKKNLDAAVEVVLQEIIPFFIERSAPSSPLSNSVSMDKLTKAQRNNHAVTYGNQQTLHLHHEGHNDSAELALLGKKLEIEVNEHPRSEPLVLIDINKVYTLPVEISGGPETGGKSSGYKFSESSLKISSGGMPQDPLGIFGELEVDAGNKEINATERPLESNLEKPDLNLSPDTSEDDSLFSSLTQSNQSGVMDSVEEIIEEEDNQKRLQKRMFTAMESFISLMKQVELKEQEIEQAKEEASMGGKDTLDKVEELKQILEHAKEANDMHAGEVYGEKAILGTELRELQSRVVSLSYERDKSIALLAEMHKTLEGRLAAVENEIQSAKQEKLEKVNAARKLLAHQESIMEKVVHESKILEQQAEENAKLQEFLLDRGRVVDMLQGEISVIYQDVRVLKEKFDEHLPLSKSNFSNQTSFIFAYAAISSPLSKSPSSDPAELPPVVKDDLLRNQDSGHHKQVLEENADREALAKDGWDFFEAREINA